MPETTCTPALVAHADWSKVPRKRWCAVATFAAGGHYRLEAPKPVGDVTTYFRRLRQRVADRTGYGRRATRHGG